MRVERLDDGDLWLRGISPFHADTLLRLPEWLDSSDPRVRARLLPKVYDDAEDEQQWRRFGVPQLEHLFASRAEIVAKDLQSLAQDDSVAFSMRIPQEHANAWLSTLNAARLALFAAHGLDESDMERDPTELEGDFERELALVRIHLMAFMQELLIAAGC
jgi:hypothetical protein